MNALKTTSPAADATVCLHPMSIEFIPMVYLEPGWTGIYDMAYLPSIVIMAIFCIVCEI